MNKTKDAKYTINNILMNLIETTMENGKSVTLTEI